MNRFALLSWLILPALFLQVSPLALKSKREALSVDCLENEDCYLQTPNEEGNENVVSYKGFQVLDVEAKDEKQLEILRTLESLDGPGVEFWSEAGKVNESVTLSVHPEAVEVFRTYLSEMGLPVSVKIEDLDDAINAEMKEISERQLETLKVQNRDPRSYYDYGNYNRLNVIESHMQQLVTQYSDMLSKRSIGTTHEGRQIHMLKLALNDGRRRSAIWMDCGIHAREWVSPSFCLYATNELLQAGAQGPLGKFDFYVIPVANPDGYVYSWDGNRMWRKNRKPSNAKVYWKNPFLNEDETLDDDEVSIVEDTSSQEEEEATTISPEGVDAEIPTSNITVRQFWQGAFGQPGFGGATGGWGQQSQFGAGGYPQTPGVSVVGAGLPAQQRPQQPGLGSSKCAGVDPNRNFDIDFGRIGSTSSPCKDTHHGPYAFSEAESQAVRDTVNSIKASQTLASFISVHAYSQFWMSPYGFSKSQPRDYQDHMRVMAKAVSALSSVYGTQYKYGPIQKVIYQASGSSVDWAYEKANVKYSFALELRDSGRYGFLLPVNQIKPTNVETYEGLKAMVNEISREYPVA